MIIIIHFLNILTSISEIDKNNQSLIESAKLESERLDYIILLLLFLIILYLPN